MTAGPTLSLGTPTSGWLPVRVEAGEQVVEFTASAVGADSLEQLCDALLNVAAGRESTADWELEPDHYEFLFAPADGQIVLEVNLVEQSRSGAPKRRSRMLRWSGAAPHIVVPFWRALKKFQTAAVPADAWRPFPSTVFAKLEERARAYKNEG
jgi:hypothetical protein